jgi:immune inhibitor A
MRRLLTPLLFSTLIALANPVQADPAAPIELTLQQPDGVEFVAIPRGDEYASWLETRDGHSVMRKDDTWFYAEKDAGGELKPGSIEVGSLSNDELQQLPLHVSPSPQPRPSYPEPIRRIERTKTKPDQQVPQAVADMPHSQNLLTILVSYTDRSISYPDSNFNQLVYGASGSVKKYYQDVSYNRFTIKPAEESHGTVNDGVIRIERSIAHPNQGNDHDVSKGEAAEVVTLADAFIDFESFDTNADGRVSSDELSIMIVAAGYSASYGGLDNALTPNMWPHRAWFTSTLTLDGVELQDYTMVAELHATSEANEHQATIGTMCHELGHLMFGLPDLYDVGEDAQSAGIGQWGLMGGGGWNRTGTWIGDPPAHMSAWSKVKTNFTAPLDVSGANPGMQIYKADAYEAARRLWIDKYKLNGEYILVENRQKTGYDAGLPGSGLLIWHIDESQTSNEDESHKLVDLEEADGLNHLDTDINKGDSGDPFPGFSNNRSFNDTSNPNSKNYFNQSTQISIENISNSSNIMTADINAMAVDQGDHVAYFEYGGRRSLGWDDPTVYAGLRVLNDTDYTSFDGVDVYITDNEGATVEIRYYTGMSGGTPSGLIHSQAGFQANKGWNRLILSTPQDFPKGVERGVVVKVVNTGYNYPASYVPSENGTGRSYISQDGNGAYYSICPSFCGDLNLAALLSSPQASNGADLAITILDAQDGTYTPGELLPIVAKIENIGDVAAVPYRITFYASEDTNITAQDAGRYWDMGALGVGENHYYTFNAGLPGDVPSGSYYIGASVDLDDANNANNSKYDPVPVTFATDATSGQILPGHSGSYHYPAQDGHGLNIEVINESITVFYWYVYHLDGTPMFLVTVGTNKGGQTEGTTYYNTGMRFGEFNTADFSQTVWGWSRITFHDCNNLTLEYAADDPSYGSGSIPMQRLTSIAGLSCSDSP